MKNFFKRAGQICIGLVSMLITFVMLWVTFYPGEFWIKCWGEVGSRIINGFICGIFLVLSVYSIMFFQLFICKSHKRGGN